MNRRKILPETGFLAQFPLMYRIKNQPQPILSTRPSILAGRAQLPLSTDAIFNEAGKRSVKTAPTVQGFRRDHESSG